MRLKLLTNVPEFMALLGEVVIIFSTTSRDQPHVSQL